MSSGPIGGGEPFDTFLRFEPGAALRSSLAQHLLLEERLSLLPGQRVGAFRVLHEIGRGGLGAVYLAERGDVDFSQRVALKVVGSRSDRSRAEILLARERKTLARLQHPYIARLVSGGRSGELLWFAMEYVEGVRIDAYCAARNLDGRGRIELLMQVCAAVGHAHAQLVVHRDLKPSNVLVTERGEVRLLDFGIAGLLDAERDDDPAAAAATPRYASPEQRAGQPAGIASDIHQLGQLLALLTADATVPRREADLAAIIAKALATRPEDRYASMDALAGDLRALLALRPIGARRSGAAARLRLLTLRHPWSSLACLLMAAALAASNTWYLSRVEQARHHAERQARTAKQIAAFMVGVFNGATPDSSRAGPPDVETLIAAGARRALYDLGDAPELQEPLLTALGGVYQLTLANPAKAAALYERAVAVAAEHGSSVPESERIGRSQLYASALRDLGRVAEGQAVIAAELGNLSDRLEHAQARADLLGIQATLAFHERRLAQSIALFDQAIAQARRLGPDEPTIHFLQLNQALALRQSGRSADAQKTLRSALDGARRVSGADHSSAIYAQSALAELLIDEGGVQALEEAGSLLADVRERTIRRHGEPSPQLLSVDADQARLQARRGDVAGARAALVEVLSGLDALPTGTRTERAQVLRSLGDLDLADGDAAAALARYRAMEEALAGSGMLDFGEYSGRIACALLALNQTGPAYALRDHALALAATAGPAGAIQDDLRNLPRRCTPAAVRAGLASFAF